MLGKCLDNVRKTMPLVHNITNYVTVNDVANVLLACGGSPIMSDEPEDVQDITAICGGLNINIGTLNKRTIEGMFVAGHKANELGHMVLLDPVGGRCQRASHQYGCKTDGGTSSGRHPRQYLGDQDAGSWKRYHQRRGCGCGGCSDRGKSGRSRCVWPRSLRRPPDPSRQLREPSIWSATDRSAM